MNPACQKAFFGGGLSVQDQLTILSFHSFLTLT